MVVDDRLVIIGSANLNERSQRGDRDSELACVVRDTDMIDSTMAGKPYKVGRFAHTLRVRLMREHLGVDVDAMEEEEANMDLLDRDPVKDAEDLEAWDPHDEEEVGNTAITKGKAHRTRAGETANTAASNIKEGANRAVEAVGFGAEKALPGINENAARAAKGSHQGSDSSKSQPGIKANQASKHNVSNDGKGFASTIVPTIEEKALAEGRPPDGMQIEDGKKGQGNGPEHGQLQKPEKPTGFKTAMDDLDKTRGNETSMQSAKAHDTRQLQHDGDDDPDGLPQDSSHPRSADSDRLEPGYATRTRHSRALSAESTASVATQASRATSETAGGSRQGKTNQQIAGSNKATDAIKKSLNGKMNAYSLPTKAPKIDPKMFADPLIDNFYKNMWMAGVSSLFGSLSSSELIHAFRSCSRCTQHPDLPEGLQMYTR
jgi:phospholipase D1/2